MGYLNKFPKFGQIQVDICDLILKLIQAFNAMTAIMTWGPVANDLDFHSVEMNKTSFATCEAYYRCQFHQR